MSTWDVMQVTTEGVLPVYVGGAVVDGSLLSSTVHQWAAATVVASAVVAVVGGRCGCYAQQAWLRRDRYVINCGEGLTTVDFDGHVSLAEKKGTCMAERRSGTGHEQ
ncbi:hypothetical protein BHM03_00033833 [Ensete ventricosum]|nr:hypothetical protein BHM03_00033833 [Ensete ventricosum]